MLLLVPVKPILWSPFVPKRYRRFDECITGRLSPARVGTISQQVILLVGAHEVGFRGLLPIPIQGVDYAVLIAGGELLVLHG